ncbi:MAG: hypothetical protein LAP61_23000 [Acidobacteriia bacterium]|nr:hypothetical protein [Terriglobia bacterium]
MMTTVGYEIGAVFLLAALLMYGTRSGFSLPGLQAGKLIPIVLGVMVLVFGVHHLGPELAAGWRSMLMSPTSRESPRPAQVIEPVAPPHTSVVDTVPAPPSRSPAKATRQSTPQWKTVVVDESLPSPTERAQPSADSFPPASPPATEQAPTPQPEKPLSVESPDPSPHDHGVKRAFKRAGHFLHITREKN